MALKIMQLIRSTLLTLTVLTSLHLSIGQQTNLFTEVWNGHNCGRSQYTNGSVFHVNLIKVLESLAVNVSTTGFDTSVAGQNNSNSVYGLRQCRGDLSSWDCHQCASTITQKLLEKCQNSTWGFIQLVGCFLRYDTHYFYNYSEGIQTYAGACNNHVSDEPETFVSAVLKVLSNITERAVWNPNLFAADGFQADSSPSRLIYGLAQCWRNLSKASCQSCLSFALSNVTAQPINSLGCANSTGAQWYAMGCQLRYEIYLFYNLPQSPPLSGIFFHMF